MMIPKIGHEGLLGDADDDDETDTPAVPVWAMVGDAGVTDEQRIDREDMLQVCNSSSPLSTSHTQTKVYLNSNGCRYMCTC